MQNEIEQLRQEFKELRLSTYSRLARGEDVSEDVERLKKMHALLARKAIELVNLVILQKDNYYLVAPADERSRLMLYEDGWKLVFPGEPMTEEEITRHQTENIQRLNYFSQHLLAVNYIDEYLTFLTQNLSKEEQQLAIQNLVVEVEAVDLGEKHAEELDPAEEYVSENVSEKKKSQRRKRETPL